MPLKRTEQREKEKEKVGTQEVAATEAGRPIYILRLRREEDLVDRRVVWDPSVVEHKNQRTSKKCCQFHRKRLFGESDSESDSSSSSDSDDEAAHEPSKEPSEGPQGAGQKANPDGHPHDHCCAHGHGHHEGGHAHGAPVGDGTAKKKPRPKCTKETCWCHTRFA
jgi:protein phosphatase 1 regulatory subunit 11